MPKFSIIIPVYNVAPYLRKCLDSVCVAVERVGDGERGTGNRCGVEIICVDDGSTDGSGEILDEYASRFNSSTFQPFNLSTFRVIHQENQGVAVARQVALDHCSGDWLCAVDPDDWVEPDFLKAFYDAICDGPVDMVWCDYYRDHGQSVRVSTRTAEDATRHLEAILQDRVWGSLCNKAFSKRFVDAYSVRFPPKGCNTAEDVVFLCGFLMHDPVIKWIPACTYHYVYRAGSLCNPKPNPEAYTPFIKSIEYIDSLFARTGRKESLRFRKQQIKFGMYDKPYISNERFATTFPDVRDLWGMKVGVWHKVLFLLAVCGRRNMVLGALDFVRRMKNILRRKL